MIVQVNRKLHHSGDPDSVPARITKGLGIASVSSQPLRKSSRTHTVSSSDLEPHRSDLRQGNSATDPPLVLRHWRAGRQHVHPYGRPPILLAIAVFLLAGLLLTGIVCHGCHSHEEEIRLFDWLSSAYADESPQRTGHITGVVRFTGKVPPPRRVETNEGGVLEISDLEVHPQTQGVRDVLVVVENPPEPQNETPHQPVVVDQKGLLFRPRVVAALADQEVRFENKDNCNHGVQTMSSIPANQINATAGPGTPITHRFQAQRDPISVGCALHPWMRAYLFVLPHRYFAVTDQRGEFRLTDLAPGVYRLRFIHPVTGWRTRREIMVRPGQTARLTVVWDGLVQDQP